MQTTRPVLVRFALVAVAAAVCLSAATASAKTLRWKFKAGDKMQYSLSNKSINEIDAGGFQLTASVKMIFDLGWTVENVASDGTASLAQNVDRLQLRLQLPPPIDIDFQYDSKSTETPEGQIWERMGPMLEALKGGKFTLKVSPTGEIAELKVPEALAKVIEDQKAEAAEGGGGGGGGGGFFQMLGVGLSEETIKSLMSQALCSLPKDDAAASAGWDYTDAMEMGPIGTMKTKYKYTTGGSEQADGKSVEKINATSEVTFEPKEEGDSDVDVFLELADQSGKGSVLFDAAAGRAVSSTFEQKVTMEGDFMGNEFERTNTQTTILVTGTSENLPADPSDAPAATEEPAAAGAEK